MWLTLSSTNKVKVGDNIIAYIEGPIFYSNPLKKLKLMIMNCVNKTTYNLSPKNWLLFRRKIIIEQDYPS